MAPMSLVVSGWTVVSITQRRGLFPSILDNKYVRWAMLPVETSLWCRTPTYVYIDEAKALTSNDSFRGKSFARAILLDVT